MYTFRPFLNSDPPRLAEIWRNQPPQRGLVQPMTAGLLEQFVLSKQFFDPSGLIVAQHEGAVVGFVHAGFGPSDDEQSLSTELGTTYLMMLREDHRGPDLAAALLREAELYLRRRGAAVLYAGGIRPLDAFYLGLYGGSELPGVLSSDPVLGSAARANGYREIDRVMILQRPLGNYRAPVTRAQRQLRREVTVKEEIAPPARTWWRGLTLATFDRSRFFLIQPGSEDPVAEVWFWDIEPLSTYWGLATTGLCDLYVSPPQRRRGLATYLVGDAFAMLASRGIVRVEAQTMQSNDAAMSFYRSLGFEKIDEGAVFRKEASAL